MLSFFYISIYSLLMILWLFVFWNILNKVIFIFSIWQFLYLKTFEPLCCFCLLSFMGPYFTVSLLTFFFLFTLSPHFPFSFACGSVLRPALKWVSSWANRHNTCFCQACVGIISAGSTEPNYWLEGFGFCLCVLLDTRGCVFRIPTERAAWLWLQIFRRNPFSFPITIKVQCSNFKMGNFLCFFFLSYFLLFFFQFQNDVRVFCSLLLNCKYNTLGAILLKSGYLI